MIQLKKDQKVYVLKSGNKWYTCVASGNGLITYSENPYIQQDDKGVKVGMKAFQESYNTIKSFDLKAECENLHEVEDYSNLVNKIMSLQTTLFEMEALVTFVDESVTNEDFKKGTNMVCEVAKKHIESIEQAFAEVAKQVPSNWAYAMFPESSWTAYPFLVEKHRIASGNMTRFADCYGKTVMDAREADRNTRELNEALNLDIHKQEKIFLDLQRQIKAKESTKIDTK